MVLECVGMVLEWIGGCWSGAGVARNSVGVVLEQLGRCWNVLEWCWSGLDGVGVAWSDLE